MRYEFYIVKERNVAYHNEIKQAVANLQRIEKVLNEDEQVMTMGKARLQEKRKDIDKATKEAVAFSETLRESLDKSEKIDVNEGNVLQYVKPSDELQERWLRIEAKRRSIESTIYLSKKLFEDKNIKLDQLLDTVGKLASKEHKCIYKKIKIESMIKKQAKVK